MQQLPGVGPFLSAYIAVTGCDPVAGTPVSSLERGLAGLNAMGPVFEALHEAEWCKILGGGCFAKGTLVAMADGSHKPVQDIQVGDWVQSRNEATGEVEARQVTGTTVHRALQTVSVTLTDPKTGQRQAIVCTPSHPFYVQGQGFTPAGSLGIGTSIVTRAGPCLAVSNVECQPAQAGGTEGQAGAQGALVYNLTVEGDHTYFVGTLGGGAWVHNSCNFHFNSEEEAKQAAFNRAGFPEDEAYPEQVPLQPGSQAPIGPRGFRTQWEHPESEYMVSHDPYGHYFSDTGDVIPPHYGVNGPGIDGTEHYIYPSAHDPMTNR